jgi:hypothetical protein
VRIDQDYRGVHLEPLERDGPGTVIATRYSPNTSTLRRRNGLSCKILLGTVPLVNTIWWSNRSANNVLG